jgi:PII-like signaling protein
MTAKEVTVVRIYLSEGHAQLDNLLKRLHDWEHVRGVTVFRGIAGFGDSGQLHTSKLVDLSLDLPLVVEFFDDPERVEQTIEHLGTVIKPGHILSWSARINQSE